MDKGKNMAGKAMGTMKQAKQMIAGRGGIFRTLAEEHGEVAALIKRAKHTSGDNAESIRERTDLMNEIRSELLAHAKAEEAVFYSRLNNQAETREIVEESKAEHRSLEHVLEQLGTVAPSTPRWMQLIEELEQAVQHHVDEEENELFPKASDVLSDEEANALDEQFRQEKQTMLSRVRQQP
jgi:hemerythrin-like domain-containing protein